MSENRITNYQSLTSGGCVAKWGKMVRHMNRLVVYLGLLFKTMLPPHRHPAALFPQLLGVCRGTASGACTIFGCTSYRGLASYGVEPAGVRWLRPGLRKYSCQLTIDTNTVNTKLQLSDNNRKVTHVKEVQSYPDHPDRFDVDHQLLCRNGLTGRCYWEVEWRGNVHISVSYRSIRRKGGRDCWFGDNDQSWSLDSYRAASCCTCFEGVVLHNNRRTFISSCEEEGEGGSSSSSSSVSNRAAVYVDCPAGTLSFYRVSSDTTFTQTLYPGFWFRSPGSSVSLC
ncbi:unnamed protein product [Oreochromis niloticus]|nr:unnamed protein product [Mustela putorius furo]